MSALNQVKEAVLALNDTYRIVRIGWKVEQRYSILGTLWYGVVAWIGREGLKMNKHFICVLKTKNSNNNMSQPKLIAHCKQTYNVTI